MIIIVIITYLFDLYHHFFLYNCFINIIFNISIKVCFIVVCPLIDCYLSQGHDKNTLSEAVKLSFSYADTYLNYLHILHGMVKWNSIVTFLEQRYRLYTCR